MDRPSEQGLELVPEEREEREERETDEELLSSIMQCLSVDRQLYTSEAVVTTPLLEIFSLSIESNHEIFDDGNSAEIYGTIHVTDAKGTTFCPYKRDVNEREKCFISMGSTLTLSFTNQDSSVFMASGIVVIKIDIKDKVRGITVINEEFCVDYEKENDYDKDKYEVVQGQYGSVGLRYVTHMFAVLAKLGICFGNEKDSDAYGTVKAHFVRTNQDGQPRSFEEDDKVRPSITLFYRNQNIELKALSGFPLWRSLLVVPAYCLLILEVDLHVNFREDMADHKWEYFKGHYVFKPSWPCHDTCCVDNIDGDNDAMVSVVWKTAHQHFGWDRKLKHLVSDPIEDPQPKKPRLLSSALPLASSLDPCSSSSSPMMEVFSIFIGSLYAEDDPSIINGVVEVVDEVGLCTIFKSDKRGEQVSCPTNKGVAFQLSPERSIKGPKLRMAFNIKGVDDARMSWGRVIWDESNIQRTISPYDRLLCTVIPGDRGYAAVHHILLSSGVQAEVKISCHAPAAAGYLIYGLVSAWYSTYGYSTCYEKEFYKLKLFQSDVANALLVDGPGGEVQLPLRRSLMSVPDDSGLVIGVNLQVQLPDQEAADESKEALKKDLEFMTCKSGELTKAIQGEYYSLEVSVKWSVV